MKRRTFLKAIASIGATLAVNPVKGIDAIAKQGIVPAFKSVQSGNTLLTPDLIAKEALRMLKFHKDAFVFSMESVQIEKNYSAKSQKQGDTIKIRRPTKL